MRICHKCRQFHIFATASMVRQIGCAPYTILYIAMQPPEGLPQAIPYSRQKPSSPTPCWDKGVYTPQTINER